MWYSFAAANNTGVFQATYGSNIFYLITCIIMISYFRFLLLSLNEKKQFLSENGNFLVKQTENTGEVSVYAVSDFFVEVHTDTHNKVKEIISFKSIDRLGQHVQHITLSELSIY
jgi:hypothetical protein